MEKQEKVRETNFLILLVITMMIILLTGETILMKWETGAIVLLLLGLAICWGVHIADKVSDSIRNWMYFILSLLACFFYGIHETSMFDFAPLMILIIVLFATIEKKIFIKLCVATYCLTMAYDFIFVLDSIELSPLFISRTMIHVIFVFVVGYLADYAIKRRMKENKNTEKIIIELEEVNRRTEDFLTNVSHELRTPINAVTGITSVMLKNEDDVEKRKDICAVQKAGNRLFEQIEDILDYTEIDTGRIMVSQDVYMITSIVNDIIIENQMLERDNNLELVFDIDSKIPSMLIGDGKKVKKILRHLIDNSYKFTKIGGIYVRIYALKKEYGINLCISISDTGVGLDEEEIEKITERFYQSNGGRNRRAGGLGLGLPIVYGLVAAMEGFIQIESEKDKGTTVCVSIPQSIADESPCMVIENKNELCVGCFLKPEKYRIPQIRNYYDQMISHIVKGMDITIHRLFKFDELEKLNSMYKLTHLFIGTEEYEENKSYFDELTGRMDVIVSADGKFVPTKDSRIRVLRKPFYCLPITNLLNTKMTDDENRMIEKHMVCPDTKVLVVDDEPMNLMVAEGAFKEYKMDIVTADSGAKAIELCETEPFDLIFLDHMMPEMDGVETLKILRKIEAESDREFTIIAFTANAVSGAKEMFLREGFDEFISKPIELNELERVLRNVLPKSSIMYEEKYSNEENLMHVVNEKEKVEDEIKASDNLDDPIEILNNFGINTKSGVQYSQGDKDFYFKLLGEFVKSYTGKKTEIENHFKNEDLKNYKIQVHALKSSSRLIGADELSEMARLAEEASDKNDISYVNEHHHELLSKYDEVVGFISQALKSETDETNPDLAEITKEIYLKHLQELMNKLENYEVDDAELIISDMCNMVYMGESVGSQIDEIRNAVDDFEYTEAVQRILTLVYSLERGDM